MSDGFGHNFPAHDVEHPGDSGSDETVADTQETGADSDRPVPVALILRALERRLLGDN
jgi:hypothetical protein